MDGLKEELKWTGLKFVNERRRTGPVQTTGAKSEIGKKTRVYWYQFDKTVDITLAKIKVLINPAEFQRGEKGTGPKYSYEKVKLSRLLPHFKAKATEETWELDEFIHSVRRAAIEAYASAQAAQAYYQAAQASVQKAEDFQKRLGMREPANKKQKF